MDDRGAPGGLHRLLKARRNELIQCWAGRTQRAIAPAPLPHVELVDDMPALVDDLAAALYPGAMPLPTGVDDAKSHGIQRLRLGFDVWEVVREYGIMHECILELAVSSRVAVTPDEQVLLARWVSRRMADAVAEYIRHRDAEHERQASEHLGFLAHELRSPLYAARLALERLRGAELAAGGRAVEVLDRSLRRTSQLIEDALTQTSLRMGLEPKIERVDLCAFLRELERDAAIEAQARNIAIDMEVSAELTVNADPRLLRSALANLLSNAVKFSRSGARVHVSAARKDGRIAIDVSDACGGLPDGKADELFKPLVQRGPDRSGYGLGLAIASEATGANAGNISVRDVPGHGCIFTVTLPAPAGSPPR